MKAVLFILLLFCHVSAFSQWTTSGNNINYTKGLVGIGVSPLYPLHVKNTTATDILVGESSDVQFAFRKNTFQLKPLGSFNQTPSIVWYSPSGAQATLGARNDGFGLQLQQGPFLISGGNVGIGVTNTAGYMLAVGGKFVAEEVVVKLKATWPDYVFEDDYRLIPLSMLKHYIKENRHLPGIPSAHETDVTGIQTGKMVTLLLEKIEELTLYVIEQKERSDELQSRMDALEGSRVNVKGNENK